MALTVDQPVLQHLRVARQDILCIESLQELGVEDHGRSIVKHADLVLQSPEVDTRLPAHTGIDHREEGSGYVDVVDTSFKGRGGKASQVGHHPSSQVDEQGVAGGPTFAKGLPHV